MTAAERMPMDPVVYLNSEYPSLSHTFIEREVRALRELGFRISTVSVRKAGGTATLGAAHAAAAGETVALQGGKAGLLMEAGAAAISSPLGVARALAAAWRLAPPGLASLARHAAYAVQSLRLARHARRVGAAHIHVHMANNGAAIAMLACRYDRGLNYSLSIHGSAEFFHVDSWRLAEKAEGATFVRCISSFGRAQVMAWTDPSHWPRFHIVHCGIDPALYPPRPEREPGPLRLVTVGRLHPIKGYSVLLEACARLKEQGVAFSLRMIGSGPEGPALERQVRERGLSGLVALPGPRPSEEVAAELDRADAMVISSFMEGVPVVLMEAMAKELGVVCTRVGGIPELVQEGVSGLMVDPGCPESLAAAVRVYAQDPSLCRTHGRAGRARVLEQYDVRQTAQGMAGHLGAVLARGERPRAAGQGGIA